MLKNSHVGAKLHPAHNPVIKGEDFRVMQVVSNLDVGGGQEVARTLAENLTAIGAKTIVCAFEDGPLREEIERQGIPVFLLPDRKFSILAFPFFLREIYDIRKNVQELVDRYQINVIQTHLLRVLNLPIKALMKDYSNLSVFWTFQNARFSLREDHLRDKKWLLKPKRWVYKLLYQKSAFQVSGYIAVSDEVKKALVDEIGPIGDRVTVIFNSVDTKRYQPQVDKRPIREKLGLDQNARIISVVATFKEQKGHRFLIGATPFLASKFSNLQILLLGDGDLRQEMENLTMELGIQDFIKFLGTRKDVPEFLAASDLFVLPSLWEGLPMALVEAMASGLPIVATEVSGSKQAILHGKTGILVPPGDVKALEEGITYLLSNPEMAGRLGAAARVRAEADFSARKQAEDHLALFSNCRFDGKVEHTYITENQF